MKQIELKGHSGCKIYLMVSDQGGSFVRKVSKNPEYNERLKKQCAKQKVYTSDHAHIPQVLDEGIIGDLYYYDMEYVRGVSVSSLLESCEAEKIEIISDFLVKIVNENEKTEVFDPNGWATAVKDKLKSTFDNIPETYRNHTIRESFKLLSNHPWTDTGTSKTHGDLTLENILYSCDGHFYLIDFLDVFYETWIMDISKIFQDLVVGWSFRHQLIKADAISENTKTRVLLLNKQFLNAIEKALIDKEVLDDIYACLLLDLLRIVPYVNDGNVHAFLNKSIHAVMHNIKRGGLYELVNTSLCWPIYKIPERQAKVDVNLP